MRFYAAKPHTSMLGPMDVESRRNYSEKTAVLIDHEVKKLVTDALSTASDVLQTHREALEKLANRLLEDEVVNKDELRLIAGPRADQPRKAS